MAKTKTKTPLQLTLDQVQQFKNAAPLPPAATQVPKFPEVCSTLWRLVTQFGVPWLTTTEEQRLAGGLGTDPVSFVVAVSEALRDHPERYPDLPGCGQAMHDQQRLATGFRCLRDLLHALATHCNTGYIVAQADALSGAKMAFRRVQTTSADPAHNPGLDHDARDLGMIPADLIAQAEEDDKTARRLAARAANKADPQARQKRTAARLKRQRELAQKRLEADRRVEAARTIAEVSSIVTAQFQSARAKPTR